MTNEYKLAIELKSEAIHAWVYEVTINKGVDYSIKTITVDKAYKEELVGESTNARTLVQESVMFLLEREPATSILSEFNLKEINKYFKEYEETIKELFG